MLVLLYILHVLICFFLIAVVLLQQGKGADLSVFGGGGTQTAFGARGAATVLHKLTVGSFVAFIVTTLAIGVLQGDGSSRLITDLPGEEQAADDAATTDEATDDAAVGDEATEPVEEEGALSPTAPEGGATEEGGDAEEGGDTGEGSGDTAEEAPDTADAGDDGTS